MSEEGKEAPQFNIEEQLQRLGEFTHVDENGNLIPEKTDAEIKAKISSIGTSMYVWGRKNAPSETIDDLAKKSLTKLVDMFPDKKDLIREEIKNTDGLDRPEYTDFLDEENK